MSTEAPTPTTTKIFQPLLEQVKNNKGKRVEIVTFAQDTVSGYRRAYSDIGILDERDLQRGLTELVKHLVPDGESRETLEHAFETDPDKVVPDESNHSDIASSEWETTQDNLVIGIRAVRDQRGESVRTWYLRNTYKKPGLVSRAFNVIEHLKPKKIAWIKEGKVFVRLFDNSVTVFEPKNPADLKRVRRLAISRNKALSSESRQADQELDQIEEELRPLIKSQ